MILLIFSCTPWTYLFFLKICNGYFLKQNTCWSAATSFIYGKTALLETHGCIWLSGNMLFLCVCHASVPCLPNRRTTWHNSIFRRMFFLNTSNSVMSEFILLIHHAPLQANLLYLTLFFSKQVESRQFAASLAEARSFWTSFK